VRVVWEESGLLIEVGRVLAVDSLHVVEAQREGHAIRIIYEGQVIGGELAREVGGSTERCEWVPMARAEEYPLLELAKVGLRVARELAGESKARHS
jgi:hypothetical protein